MVPLFYKISPITLQKWSNRDDKKYWSLQSDCWRVSAARIDRSNANRRQHQPINRYRGRNGLKGHNGTRNWENVNVQFWRGFQKDVHFPPHSNTYSLLNRHIDCQSVCVCEENAGFSPFLTLSPDSVAQFSLHWATRFGRPLIYFLAHCFPLRCCTSSSASFCQRGEATDFTSKYFFFKKLLRNTLRQNLI